MCRIRSRAVDRLSSHRPGRIGRLLLALAVISLTVTSLVAGAGPAGSARADTETTTVPTGTAPGAVAVNPVTNKIYVGNRSSGNVTVIDGATNATTTVARWRRPVGGGGQPGDQHRFTSPTTAATT